MYYIYFDFGRSKSAIVNLLAFMLQVYFMDVFLGYQFSTYGADVWRVSELPVEDRVDPMAKVFPKVRYKQLECSAALYSSTMVSHSIMYYN